MQQARVDNRYALLGVLGCGGMGEVYLARDEVLGREVALKVPKEHYSGSIEFRERLRREALAAASLSHPNIVSVYDGGEARDGTPYIAMERLEGGTLAERIAREGALGWREAAGIGRQVALALSEAHRRGVVHRDIKPHNVFLTGDTFDSIGSAKVGDFGIARAAEATVITEASLILGTVRYLSPEQAKGELVGPKSDLYSLGVVLYEMLTGQVPFEAEGLIAIAMKHISEAPPSPKEAIPDVPEGLEAITLGLLSKDPAYRYPDASTLAHDLERVARGLPPESATLISREDAPTERLEKVLPVPGRGNPGQGEPTQTLEARSLSAVIVCVLALALAGVAGGDGAVPSLYEPLLASKLAAQDPPGPSESPVPEGPEQGQAESTASGAGTDLAVESGASAKENEGVVAIEQSPTGSGEAKDGATVKTAVTGKPSVTSMPGFAGRPGITETQVTPSKAVSPGAEPKSGKETEASSSTFSAGAVTEQDPGAARGVKDGLTADLTPGSGSASTSGQRLATSQAVSGVEARVPSAEMPAPAPAQVPTQGFVSRSSQSGNASISGAGQEPVRADFSGTGEGPVEK